MSRTIDADALIADCQLAQKQADRHGREFANAFYSGGGEVSTEWWCVEDMIENAPTIEPERKKGRWIPCTKKGLPLSEMAYREGQKWYGYKCSNCNFIYKGNALTESPYCQKCGARMEGE